MADGKVEFEIVGDATKINKSITEVTENIKKESKKWDGNVAYNLKKVEKTVQDSSGTVSATMEALEFAVAQALINATAALISAFAEWASASIEVAANLEQIQGVVNTTFGESGAQRIEDWSKRAGTQFGYTELQAKKLSSSIGVMLKASGLTAGEAADMSTSLAGLASDMGAFLNMDADKALDKIKNAMQGNASALKDLGIQMSGADFDAFYKSLGMDGEFKNLTTAEQMLVRYQYILQQTEEIQGYYARETSKTYHGMQDQIDTQMARAQENLGKQILPFSKQLKQNWLGFLQMLTGDSGVVVTGSQSQLESWLAGAQEEAAAAREELDALGDAYAGIVGMERDDFEPGIYDSYGEFILNTMRVRQMWTSGSNREKLDAAIPVLEEALAKQTEAEAKISDLQAQIDYLLSTTTDTTAEGVEAVDNLAEGMASQEGTLQAEVDRINAILSGIGTGGSVSWLGSLVGSWFSLDGSHESGLNYVPFDNYLASLHEGEGILTAEENRIWQRFKNGQSNGMDYEALGGVMRDNVHAGGNVYLDGRTVGSVISDIQGSSYRKLQRSGWQS